MATKENVFNLAFGALLLSVECTNADTDKGNPFRVLRQHFPNALQATLKDMDLDSTSTFVQLELVTVQPVDKWMYAYKYPVNCAFFRRVCDSAYRPPDTMETLLPKKVLIFNGEKVILTQQEFAVGEMVMSDVPLESLGPEAELAIAYRLAFMSSSLITGKGAKTLRQEIWQSYLQAKSEAQEADRIENAQPSNPYIDSDWVAARTGRY